MAFTFLSFKTHFVTLPVNLVAALATWAAEVRLPGHTVEEDWVERGFLSSVHGTKATLLSMWFLHCSWQKKQNKTEKRKKETKKKKGRRKERKRKRQFLGKEANSWFSHCLYSLQDSKWNEKKQQICLQSTLQWETGKRRRALSSPHTCDPERVWGELLSFSFFLGL